ncbi:MAG: response regulator [Gammaproteobacteria bacterium]
MYWVDSTIVPMLSQDGKQYQYISILRDITVKKINENKLAALRRALDAGSEMILITDAKGCIEYANPELCRATGCAETDLLGKQPEILNSPNADRQSLEDMTATLKQGKAWKGRVLNRRNNPAPTITVPRFHAHNASEYWAEISVTPILDSHRNIVGQVHIRRDISALVAHELAIQIENEDTKAKLAIAGALQNNKSLKDRLEDVLGILFELKAFKLQRKGGVFLKQERSDVLDLYIVRGDFGEAFLRREKQVPLKRWHSRSGAAVSREIIVTDECLHRASNEHRCQGMQPHGHYIVTLSAGDAMLGLLFLYTDPFPVQNEARLTMLAQVGETIALTLLSEQVQNSLKTARDKALQATMAKSEFLANMSHEIRTPMNGVLGMLDLLKETSLSREQWDLLETASNSAEVLLEIINDILDFSKLESGKIEVEIIEFNILDLVEEVCSLIAGRAHAKGLELNCFLPSGLAPYRFGDPMKIRQILTNLIGNAVKFTEQGEVTVTVTEVPNREGEKKLQFQVQDTGIGISPEQQIRLFKPFTQADSSTARRFGGTGLGLTISRTLVELLSGSIEMESALHVGTTFRFILPLPLSQSAETDCLPRDFSGRRVLIVDDNGTNRVILKHHLSHWGLLVKEADSAKTALAELESAARRHLRFDLLLTDLHMPETHGFDLIQTVLAMPLAVELPCILLSSGGPCSETECRKLGIIRALNKPVRQNQLFDAVSAALRAGDRTSITSEHHQQSYYPDYSGKHLLVVEDNKVNQKVIRALLAKFKIEPDLANDGLTALSMLDHRAYELILMDCQMPVLDGYETVRIIRNKEMKSDGMKRLPVVALTAHATPDERDKCIAAGMDDFLSKPIDRAKLERVLARFLGEALSESTGSDESARHDSVPTIEHWDRHATLSSLDGDEKLLAEMISIFREQAPSQLNLLHGALARKDFFALAETSHRIKGMAAHFYAKAVVNRASILEEAARKNGDSDCNRLVSELNDVVEQLVSELR